MRWLLAEKELFDFEPVVDAFESLDVDVVGRGIDDAFTFEAAELTGVVVDEVVGAEDALVAAVDDVRGGDEGKVLREPTVFLMKRAWDLHGRRGDEDLVVHLEAAEDALGFRHDGEGFEEVFGAEGGLEDFVAVGGDDLPEPFAVEVFDGDLLVEVLVVAREVFAERVGHHLIHIYTNSFH